MKTTPIAGSPADPDDDVYIGRSEVAMWMRVVSSWVCMLLYIWSLLAPVLLPDRYVHSLCYLTISVRTDVSDAIDLETCRWRLGSRSSLIILFISERHAYCMDLTYLYEIIYLFYSISVCEVSRRVSAMSNVHQLRSI